LLFPSETPEPVQVLDIPQVTSSAPSQAEQYAGPGSNWTGTEPESIEFVRVSPEWIITTEEPVPPPDMLADRIADEIADRLLPALKRIRVPDVRRHRLVWIAGALCLSIPIIAALRPWQKPQQTEGIVEEPPQLSGVFPVMSLPRPMLLDSVADEKRVPTVVTLTNTAAPAVAIATKRQVPATPAPPARNTSQGKPAVSTPTSMRPAPSSAFQGHLIVDSNPRGATVLINQRQVGVTPLDLARYPASSYAVWVERDGYDRWSAGVLVPANKVTRVKADLQRSR